MSWTPLSFGKHRGKTLPQVLFQDPDWFFWAMDAGALVKHHSRAEVERADRRARSIRIPQTKPGKVLVAEYFVHPPTGKFGGVHFVPKDRPPHEGGSATWREPHIDLAAPRNIKFYDKTGCMILVRDVKAALFPGVKRLTKKRLEEFFASGANFHDP